MSIWNIEEYKPRPTRAQPHLSAAYLLDKERTLPDLEAGFRVQSSDQAWVPQPSYLFLIDHARLERADPYAWGPEYESILQTRIDQNEGYVCPLDSMSERDIRYNLDGFPMNQPPMAPNKDFVRAPETVKKGESIGEKRKAAARPEQEKQPKKGIPSADILSEQLGETPKKGIPSTDILSEQLGETPKKGAPFGYFPDVTYRELRKNAYGDLVEELKHAGDETISDMEKALKFRKKQKAEVESVKLDESKSEYDPLDEVEKTKNSATDQLDAEMMKNINSYEKDVSDRREEEAKMIYDIGTPMRSQEYKRLFQTPQKPTDSIGKVLYGYTTPASNAQQGKILIGNNEKPVQPEGKRSTTLNAPASSSRNPRSNQKTPRAILFSEVEELEEKSYSPPSTPMGARYSPNFPLSPESVLVSPAKQQTPTPKRPQVIAKPTLPSPKSSEQKNPVTPAPSVQVSTPSTEQIKEMKQFRLLQDIAREYGVKGTSYAQLKKRLEDKGMWLDAKQKLKPHMK